MTMRVNNHRGPHTYVQRLIHRAGERGAARADVEIHRGRLEYQDDLGTHETIDTSDVEPDGIYTIVRALEEHRAPDGMHVHVHDDTTRGNLAARGGPKHMKTVSQGDAAPPERTPNGKFEVHLKRTNWGYGEIIVMEPDGATSHRSRSVQMAMKHTPTGRPGEEIERSCANALAVHIPTGSGENAVGGHDYDEIEQTALGMFAALVASMDRDPDSGPAWPDGRDQGHRAREAFRQPAGNPANLPDVPGRKDGVPGDTHTGERRALPAAPHQRAGVGQGAQEAGGPRAGLHAGRRDRPRGGPGGAGAHQRASGPPAGGGHGPCARTGRRWKCRSRRPTRSAAGP